MLKKTAFCLVFISILFPSCSSVSTGNIKIYFTDLPIAAESVKVTISSMDAHATGGTWIQISTEMKTIDLVQLQNRQERFADVDIALGTYTEIRLSTYSGQIVINGQSYDLVIPSTEVKVPAHFDIVKDGKTEIVLDFDADKSIEVHPTGGNNEYILRPVITVVSITM
jgi:hypothetical protein